MQKTYIHTFDFDGTLTTADTMIELIRFVRGTTGLLTGLACLSPLLILMKLGLYPNWRAKERLLAWFFGGMPEDDFNHLCNDFAQARQDLIHDTHAQCQRATNRHRQRKCGKLGKQDG